jgi:hypothetical protein
MIMNLKKCLSGIHPVHKKDYYLKKKENGWIPELLNNTVSGNFKEGWDT